MVEDVLVNGFNTNDLKALSVVIHELKSFFGFTSYARMASKVGVSGRVLLDRAKRYQYPPSLFNFHRTLQGLIRLCDEALGESPDNSSELPNPYRNRWVSVPSNLRSQTVVVGELLSQLVTQIQRSNEPDTLETLLSPIDKAQLIAALETTLLVLKAPMVEIGLFKRVANRLLTVAKSVGTHGVSAAVGAAAGQGGLALAKLVGDLLK